MGYGSLRACIADLEQTGQLVRIEQEVNPYLEAAEIHRRVCQARGPAVFYARLKGCRFPMVSNLFGTLGAPVSSSATRWRPFAASWN
jgi:4-hydroxy-3-polyprenylbenzoate decarboxylase